jgi:hypothetical protein
MCKVVYKCKNQGLQETINFLRNIEKEINDGTFSTSLSDMRYVCCKKTKTCSQFIKLKYCVFIAWISSFFYVFCEDVKNVYKPLLLIFFFMLHNFLVYIITVLQIIRLSKNMSRMWE